MREDITTEMKGISRIDSKSTHGWYVRIYRNGKTHSKLYSDKKYNGKERALKFAKKARQLALETFENVPKNPIRRIVLSDKRNKSGVVGVNKTSKKLKSGVDAFYYQVTWSPKPGQIRNKQWSVNKYGDKKAFSLAKKFRHKVMKDLHGELYDPKNEEA